jgi:hypothetical protein
VERFEREDFQYEHVERALQQGGIGRCLHTDILVIQTSYMKMRGQSSLFCVGEICNAKKRSTRLQQVLARDLQRRASQEWRTAWWTWCTALESSP